LLTALAINPPIAKLVLPVAPVAIRRKRKS
jgi:hypothetical protein